MLSLTNRGIRVPLEKYEKHIKNIEKELTVRPEIKSDYVFPGQNPYYKVFLKSINNLYIPKFYGFQKFKEETINKNELKEGDDINLVFIGKLKDELKQNEAADAVVNGLTKNYGGILNLPTGYGKTTVSLHVLCEMKKKTLIVVHKEFLMNQWIERINQFIPRAKIGKIQASVFDIENCDIVIGMLQSLSMKEYNTNAFDSFGLMIIDETHHICTRTFSKLLLKASTKYVLGLSATIERKDGLTKVLHWFLGDILFKIERKNQTNVEIKTMKYTDEKYKEEFPMNQRKKANMAAGINDIVELEKRNEMIINIMKICKDEERKVILLTDRRNHCEIIKNMLNTIGIQCGLYVGSMKNSDLKESENQDIILATFSMANEGLDIPSLDTLILATPKSDIIQSIGRILREGNMTKKNNPRVYDIIDKWGPFEVQYFKRYRYYKHAEFNVVPS